MTLPPDHGDGGRELLRVEEDGHTGGLGIELEVDHAGMDPHDGRR